MTSRKDVKVCFVAPNAYSLFDPSTHYIFGGIEVQAYTLAVELARRPGYDVSFIVFDYGQGRRRVSNVDVRPYGNFKSNFLWLRNLLSLFRSKPPAIEPRNPEEEELDVVHPASASQKASSEGGGLSDLIRPAGRGRVVRLKDHRWTCWIYNLLMWAQECIDCFNFVIYAWDIRRSTGGVKFAEKGVTFAQYIQDPDRVRTYSNLGADVYISFGANDLTAELTAFCRSAEKRMLLIAASDTDFHDTYFWGSNIRNYYGDVGDRCHYALMRVHRLITQNERQRELAWKLFHRDSNILVNPIDLSAVVNPDRAFEERTHLLWIGKADNTKQPEVFVQIARALPDIACVMILNPSHDLIEERVRREAPPNLRILPGVPRNQIPELMESAFAVVNSSRFEGYPNTFLEAYRAGTPVASLNVDPNDVIATEKTGIIANGNIDELIEGCRRLTTLPGEWTKAARAGHVYVRRVHGQDVVVDGLVEEIRACLDVDLKSEGLVDLKLGGRPLAPSFYED